MSSGTSILYAPSLSVITAFAVPLNETVAPDKTAPSVVRIRPEMDFKVSADAAAVRLEQIRMRKKTRAKIFRPGLKKIFFN